MTPHFVFKACVSNCVYDAIVEEWMLHLFLLLQIEGDYNHCEVILEL